MPFCSSTNSTVWLFSVWDFDSTLSGVIAIISAMALIFFSERLARKANSRTSADFD
jgi:hypothetical protein